MQASGLINSPPAEIGSVAAAQIDEQEFLLTLRMDGRVAARNPIIHQDDVVAHSAAQRTVAS
ncbi:MAG: hypothetical protein U1G07_23220 [Verrucomicrobiota bacterium]